MEKPSKTITGIIDNYWAQRIRNECIMNDIELRHELADNVLIEILNSIGLTETIKVFKKLRNITRKNPTL